MYTKLVINDQLAQPQTSKTQKKLWEGYLK